MEKLGDESEVKMKRPIYHYIIIPLDGPKDTESRILKEMNQATRNLGFMIASQFTVLFVVLFPSALIMEL